MNKLFLNFLSFFGIPWIFIPLFVYLFPISHVLAYRAILAIGATETLCFIIKMTYRKERPIPVPENTLYQKYVSRAFPSVHTARVTVFCSVINLTYFSPIILFGSILGVVAVAYSRIGLKKHDLTDVVGGFLIGLITTVVAMRM